MRVEECRQVEQRARNSTRDLYGITGLNSEFAV